MYINISENIFKNVMVVNLQKIVFKCAYKLKIDNVSI